MALESIQAGPWSLVSALFAISLAWITRDALIGLFVGVASTGPIYGAFKPAAVGVPSGFVGRSLGTALGAVFSGGIFGDHTSPISDTTVLASSTSGSDHMVHVRSQLPYALISTVVAATLFFVLGFVRPEGFRVIPY